MRPWALSPGEGRPPSESVLGARVCLFRSSRACTGQRGCQAPRTLGAGGSDGRRLGLQVEFSVACRSPALPVCRWGPLLRLPGEPAGGEPRCRGRCALRVGAASGSWSCLGRCCPGGPGPAVQRGTPRPAHWARDTGKSVRPRGCGSAVPSAAASLGRLARASDRWPGRPPWLSVSPGRGPPSARSWQVAGCHTLSGLLLSKPETGSSRPRLVGRS